MASPPVIEAHRRDVRSHRHELSKAEREKLVKPYLPPAEELQSAARTTSQRDGVTAGKKRKQKPIRSFLKSRLHALIYFVVHLIFGVFIRLRQTYHAVTDRILALLYYHHRTPELIQRDVKNLSRLPEHLSVILTLKGEEQGGLEALMDDIAELSAWCASGRIPILSVYEKSGILKPNMRILHSLVSQRLSSYFGSATQTPRLYLHAPNYPSYPASRTQSPSSTPSPFNSTPSPTSLEKTINILLLSSTDGRDTLVDLTRTLAEMSQSHKLHPRDITQDLLDAELSATTSITLPRPHQTTDFSSATPNTTSITTSATTTSADPDLLIIFGPYARLDGYPPWQVRLTEIFCVGDSGGGSSGRSGARVEYQGFLRGLWKFADTEMRFGR